MSSILAIDGGGTKTHVLLSTESGEVLGEGFGGPTNLETVLPSEAVKHMQAALTQAVTGHSLERPIVWMGLAGVDTQQGLDEAAELFSPLFHQFQPKVIKTVSDVEIALANGSTAANAIALIAGTGSNCIGHNADGQVAQASGGGHLLADEGSGYAMGLAALKMATKSHDGRAPHSLLEELMLKHFQVPAYEDLDNKIYQPVLTKLEIAELAREVETAALQNDAAALTIVAQTVAEWLEMVHAVVTRLKLQNRATDLVLSGGLAKVAILFEPFQKDLSDHYPLIKVIRPTRPPVYGALALARDLP